MATVFSNGATIEGANIFPPFYDPDTRSNLGIAIANDSDTQATFQILVNIDGNVIGNTFTLPPRSNISRFVDEFLTLPAGLRLLTVRILATQPLHVTGLFFAGDQFTTIPPTIY
jgi:hypothetical protein